MTSIVLNGAPHTTAATTVAGLIAELAFPQGTVLVEHNGTALRREEWEDRPLVDHDRLELLRIVAGG